MEHKVYGCKVHKFYLNKRIAHLEATQQAEDDIFLVATCVVTDRAKSKRVKEILDQLHQDKRVYIAGCGSITKGEATDRAVFFKNYPELAPYEDKILLLAEDPAQSANSFTNGLTTPGQKLRTKNYVIIEKKGWQEIVITWINLAARWSQNTRNADESRLPELLKAILEQTNIPRIRISSIDPQYLTDEFFEIVKNPRFVPHFHFSIQSFSDKVLKLMNRGYLSDKLDEVLTKIRNLDRPDRDQISIWADIICGFPGETEEDFEQTCQGVQKYRITKLHAFPFSDHHKADPIPASRLPDQVPNEIRKERNRKLIELGDQVRDDRVAQNYGHKFQVLIEETKNWKSKWRTENYIHCIIPGEHQKGELVEVTLDEKNCDY